MTTPPTFKYRSSATRKKTWMEVDRAKTFAAAKTLNTLLTAPGADLVAHFTQDGNTTIGDAARLFPR